MDIVDKILCPCLHQNSGWNWREQLGRRRKKERMRLLFHISNNTVYFTFNSLPDHNTVSSRKWSYLNCSCGWFFLLISLASSLPAEFDSEPFLGHICRLCDSICVGSVTLRKGRTLISRKFFVSRLCLWGGAVTLLPAVVPWKDRDTLSQQLHALNAPLHTSVCSNRLQVLLYGQKMGFDEKNHQCDCESSHRNGRILRLMKTFGFVQNSNSNHVPVLQR